MQPSFPDNMLCQCLSVCLSYEDGRVSPFFGMVYCVVLSSSILMSEFTLLSESSAKSTKFITKGLL